MLAAGYDRVQTTLWALQNLRFNPRLRTLETTLKTSRSNPTSQDDLSWAVFHYSGAAAVVGQSYLGGLLCSADGRRGILFFELLFSKIFGP